MRRKINNKKGGSEDINSLEDISSLKDIISSYSKKKILTENEKKYIMNNLINYNTKEKLFNNLKEFFRNNNNNFDDYYNRIETKINENDDRKINNINYITYNQDISNQINNIDNDNIIKETLDTFFNKEIIENNYSLNNILEKIKPKKKEILGGTIEQNISDFCSSFQANNITDIHALVDHLTNHNYEDLNNYILEYIKRKQENIVIEYEKRNINTINYNIIGNGNLNININCHDYNYNFVINYQKDLINNKQKILDFIQNQQLEIQQLHIVEKRIISDYTNPDAFNLYSYYIKNNRVPDDTNPLWDKINDAFATQIYRYISINPHLNQDYLIYFDNWISNDRDRGFRSIDHINKSYTNIWNQILKFFIEDVNHIIKKMKPLTDDIYCYRGVSVHYVNNIDSMELDIEGQGNSYYAFTSDRISSFTFNFDIAKNFACNFTNNWNNANNTAVIYRTLIKKGSKVLFATPLSYIQNEIEILTPSGSLFLYNKNALPKIEFNNIKETINICNKDINKIHSMDVILLGTPN